MTTGWDCGVLRWGGVSVYMAIAGMAALHEEFAPTFGSASRAKLYRARAATVESALREHYWNQDHWWTNYPGLANNKDEMWYDDQVWSLYFKLSDQAQTAILYRYVCSAWRT